MSDEDLVFDGKCPVCGDQFTTPAPESIETNESYNGRVCMLPKDEWKHPDEPGFLIHLPQVEANE